MCPVWVGRIGGLVLGDLGTCENIHEKGTICRMHPVGHIIRFIIITVQL